MRRRRLQRSPWVLLGAFVFSAAVHVLLGLPLREYLAALMAEPSDKPPVKVVKLSSSAWSKSMQDARKRARRQITAAQKKAMAKKAKKKAEEAKKKREAEKKKQEEESKRSGKLVRVPKTKDDKFNPDAEFVADKNSNVKKQMIASRDRFDPELSKNPTNYLQKRDIIGRKGKKAVAPGAGARGVGSSRKTIKGQNKKKAGQKTSKDKTGSVQKLPKQGDSLRLEMPTLQRKDNVNLRLSDGNDLAPKLNNQKGKNGVRGNSDRMRLPKLGMSGDEGKDTENSPVSQEGSKAGVPTLDQLMPTISTVTRLRGSPDRPFDVDMEEGPGTFLNARRFKYSTFFYRVQDGVSHPWRSTLRREMRRRDPTGSIYRGGDLVTTLQVTLTDAGRVDAVNVLESSGITFLDNIAVRAFHTAESFPNPPKGIVSPSGFITFSFKFIVLSHQSSPLDLFR